jgi:hypothetical protein
MILMVAVHPIDDYERWKAVFDDGQTRRGGNGVLRHWVYRSVDDEKEVMVAFEFESREAAENMLRQSDPELWMDRTGIDIYPAVMIGEQMEVVDYVAQAPAAGASPTDAFGSEPA